MGGFLGTLMAAIVALPLFQGLGGEQYNAGAQLGKQVLAAGFTTIYTAIVTFVILVVVKAVFGLRVSPEEEKTGVDEGSHGEHAYQ